MNESQQALWQRLQDFELDDPSSAFPFSARLARDNGWSRRYAQRVIAEYRRFIFLCVTAEHVVCPSDQVDQAWHQHLTFTHSYWDELCGEVLGRPLHHGPTKGGAAENRKHVDMYERTLRSYEAVFGQLPPRDIWPPTERRFDEDVAHRRVNTRRNWIVPKCRWPRLPGHHASVIMAGTLLVPLLGAVWNPFTFSGPVFLALYGTLFVIALMISIYFGRLLREPDDGEDFVLRPNTAACLAHTDMAPIMTTICRLVQGGSLELVKVQSGKLIKKESFRLRAKRPLLKDLESQGKRSLAQAIYDQASEKDGVEMAALVPQLAGELLEIRQVLEQEGLLESEASYAAARSVARWMMGGLIAFGAIKLVVGLASGKPVMFLVVSLMVTGVALAWLSHRPRRTHKGERILNRYLTEYSQFKTLDAQQGLTPEQVAMAAGLFGLGAFSAVGFELIHDAWQQSFSQRGGWASSGCSAGCGDGGCGGGGGCGGCGGD